MTTVAEMRYRKIELEAADNAIAYALDGASRKFAAAERGDVSLAAKRIMQANKWLALAIGWASR